jgi:hypothetical protein
MNLVSTLSPTGTLSHRVIRGHQHRQVGRDAAVVKAPWTWKLRNLPFLMAGGICVLLAHLFTVVTGFPVMYGTLRAMKFDGNLGIWVDYGVVGYKVVTTAGVGYIVDAFQNSVELEDMKYHGYGTGTTAEASGDTALVTELTTQYATDNVRPTGTTTEGASANIYRTVATLSPNAGGTIAITEHGVFSQAATGGGVLLDRTVFSAINLVASSDSLQTTYELTLTAGS